LFFEILDLGPLQMPLNRGLFFLKVDHPDSKVHTKRKLQRASHVCRSQPWQVFFKKK
jgi:hypothetical protein